MQTSLPAASPTATLRPVATVVVEPTPASLTVIVWGPVEFSPEGASESAKVLQQQIEEFELLNPDIEVQYEPKAATGTGSLLNYLRSASTVAPSILPDLVIIPVTDLAEAARTGLLAPLDRLIEEDVQAEFYPFATRDTLLEGGWRAIPLVVKIEHGATRVAHRGQIPTTFAQWLEEKQVLWLFRGQASAEGEMSNAILQQLLAINGQMPGKGALPPKESLIALFEGLREAQEAGLVPQQVLTLDSSRTLFSRLEGDQPALIQTNSYEYLLERARSSGITYAPIPSLNGQQLALVDGYLIAISTSDPRKQQAAASYLNWLIEPQRLAAWSRTTHWIPAQRSALTASVNDAGYATFLGQRLENGWLRPSGQSWSGFAQVVQEQFRALLAQQVAPAEAVETIFEIYESP